MQCGPLQPKQTSSPWCFSCLVKRIIYSHSATARISALSSFAQTKNITDLLPQNTSVRTPNSLCPDFQIFDWIFFFFFFDGCTINQSKQSSVNGQFFYYSSCKNRMWTHIFNYTEALHSDDFNLFTSAKVVLNRRAVEHFLQKQCTVCAAFADAHASFLERLLSGRSLFPWFCAFFLLFIGFVQPLITDSFKPAISEDG